MSQPSYVPEYSWALEPPRHRSELSWRLDHCKKKPKKKTNRAPLSVSLQQGSKCLKGVYYSTKIHCHSTGIHFQISKTFGSMKSQVMKPPFVLIEGDTYNSRRLMLKWVVPRSQRWQGQTPVRQSAWGVIIGLYFIGGTWNYSLADTVAEAVSHSDTVGTSTAHWFVLEMGVFFCHVYAWC